MLAEPIQTRSIRPSPLSALAFGGAAIGVEPRFDAGGNQVDALGRRPGPKAQSARKSLPAMTASAHRTVAANRRWRRAEWGPRRVIGIAEEDRVVKIEDEMARVPPEDRKLPRRQQLTLKDH